jgi:predicted lipid-binding transport protein (Tim44 family)
MNTRCRLFSGKALALMAVLGAGAMVTVDFAEARSGRGGSVGSRGSKTFSSPPATKTAPAAQPIQKSITQPGRPGAAATAQQASRGGSMVRNLLLGGLIGAGLASLFGMGGGLAAVLGFVLQGLMIAGLVMLAIMLFRRLRGGSGQPAMATATAGAGAAPTPGQQAYRASMGGMGVAAPELVIGGDDYNSFERLLKEVQLAYANADLKSLEQRLTPEMLSNFANELEENKRRGVSNDLSEPTLLQGDLAEAWREGASEYATVAMRYELIDALVDVKSGRVVEGSTTEPQEVTELWTFYRPTGSGANKWELSAIQQA